MTIGTVKQLSLVAALALACAAAPALARGHAAAEGHTTDKAEAKKAAPKATPKPTTPGRATAGSLQTIRPAPAPRTTAAPPKSTLSSRRAAPASAPSRTTGGAARTARMVFGGRAPGAKRHILETTFTGAQGFDPARQDRAVLDDGRLVNSKENRVALRNALIRGSQIGAPNPGGALLHHVTSHILAMKRIVDVPLGGGKTAVGVEYIGADPAKAGQFAARLLYRQGKELKDVPLAQAPAGTKHVAFLEGSSTGSTIIPGKSMGDTWHFWDVHKNGYQSPLDTGAKLDGTKVVESDGVKSAFDSLMEMVSADKVARYQLDLAPRLRADAPGTPGTWGHRQVLTNALVGANVISANEVETPAHVRVIPDAIQTELYKGTYDAATRLGFVKAVEKLVKAEPPDAQKLTVYGFARQASHFDTEFARDNAQP